MKSHSKSEVDLLSCELVVEVDGARKEGTLLAINKALIQCTHFLAAHQHIALNTNFDKLVELVVSCGGETLQTFLDRAEGNAKMVVIEFVKALGTLGEEFLPKRLHKAPSFSII